MCSQECGNDVDYAVCHACSTRAAELAFKRGFDAGVAFEKNDAPTPKALRRQRDELADALRVYLQAGDKETREAASIIAKAALAKVTR